MHYLKAKIFSRNFISFYPDFIICQSKEQINNQKQKKLLKLQAVDSNCSFKMFLDNF